ncbi:MAG: transposase [Terriglobia bacterium]|jgi:REP element-mobilizing transposase RayT
MANAGLKPGATRAKMVTFRRKNIRLPRACYIGQQWYLLTACTQDRIPRLAESRIVNQHLGILREEAHNEGFAIQAYCFMPDHLHLLVNGTRETSDCLAFINGFKQSSAYDFKQTTEERLWQHKPFDHILRSAEHWEPVAWYIWMNPVRKGLCARPQDWPFSGSETLDWKRLVVPLKQLWIPPWKKAGVEPGFSPAL